MLIRVETMDGSVKWRNVPDLEHGTLCRSFGFDPCSTWFDLPSSARGIGSASGDQARGPRHVAGYVHQGPRDAPPIGTITLVREDEKIRDTDPMNARDFFNLEGRR